MDVYKYKAIDLHGKIIKGKKIANKEIEFIKDLHNDGLYILNYKRSKKFNMLKNINYITYKDIGMLCKQLGELLKCGINIEKALEILSNEKLKNPIRNSIFIIKSYIEKGESLFDSINKFPSIYPNFMRQMVLVGEKSGELDEIFISLSKHYTKEYKIRKNIKGALMYPVVVFIMVIMATLFITLNILPKFMDNFLRLNKPIPKNIARIIKFNSIIKSYKFHLSLLVVCMILYFLYKRGCFQKFLEKVIFNTSLGGVYKEMCEISIIKSLSILLSSGIPIISALDIIINSINNIIIKNKLSNVVCDIKEGVSLSESFRREKMFNEFFLSMISVGEKIGNLEELIEHAVAVKEEDIKSLTNKIIKSIEPVTILILGTIITFIMINILIPMINTMDSIM